MAMKQHPFDQSYVLAYEEAKKKIIEIAIDTRNLSNALADPKTATALDGILNPTTSEQGASSQLLTLNDLITRITANYRNLQPEVKKTTEAIKSSVTEVKEAVKSITSEEEAEMDIELIERTRGKIKSLIKEAEKIPPLEIEIPVEFEELKIEELKSALETLSDEITKQIAELYNSIGLRLCCKMRLMTYCDTFKLLN